MKHDSTIGIGEEKKETKGLELLKNAIDQLLKTIHNNRFSITVGGETLFVNASDILYFEADSNYTNIYLENKSKITSTKNLKKIEENILGNQFVRIHHSYIINIENVITYNKGMTKRIKMRNGKELEISRSKANEVLLRLETYFPNLF